MKSIHKNKYFTWPCVSQNMQLAQSLDVAFAAGEILKKNFSGSYKTYIKEDRSAYTPFDEEAEELIRNKIFELDPQSKILGEELSPNEDITGGNFWVIDGIDGTTNFSRHIPICNVTFAKIEKNETIIGIVYDFLHDELFYALKGEGAYLNGEKIRINERRLDESVITFAPLLYNKWREKGVMEKKVVDAVWISMKEIAFQSDRFHREFQAGALELAWLACGRLDGYISSWTNPWDLSAGVLLVKEAGGIITNIEGGNWFPSYWGVIAGSKTVHPEILKILQSNYRKKD